MAQQTLGRSASALHLALIAQAIPRLSRDELADLAERLIDRLDDLDPDADVEDGDEDCAVDDIGCDLEDEGDLEQDEARHCPTPDYGEDQRVVLGPSPFGPQAIYRH